MKMAIKKISVGLLLFLPAAFVSADNYESIFDNADAVVKPAKNYRANSAQPTAVQYATTYGEAPQPTVCSPAATFCSTVRTTEPRNAFKNANTVLPAGNNKRLYEVTISVIPIR